jgi:Fe-S-cluster-containing dehydrogenase component
MAKYAMVIDVARCTACYSCFVACKDEYWENDYPPYTAGQPRHGQFWMNLTKQEQGAYPYIRVTYMPRPCMHCQNPSCLKAAKDGAIYKKRNGIVVIDPEKAVGQKPIVDACPYGSIYWNPARKLPQKCTFCAHRLAEGKIPRCVLSCPSGCLNFGDLADPESEVARLLKTGRAEVFHPEFKTQPSVYYLNLDRITRSFIAGAVVLGDINECAKGALVTLRGPQGKAARTKANAFGNFEIAGLDPGKYSLKIGNPGYTAKSLQVDLKTSQYLGDIILKKV